MAADGNCGAPAVPNTFLGFEEKSNMSSKGWSDTNIKKESHMCKQTPDKQRPRSSRFEKLLRGRMRDGESSGGIMPDRLFLYQMIDSAFPMTQPCTCTQLHTYILQIIVESFIFFSYLSKNHLRVCVKISCTQCVMVNALTVRRKDYDCSRKALDTKPV